MANASIKAQQTYCMASIDIVFGENSPIVVKATVQICFAPHLSVSTQLLHICRTTMLEVTDNLWHCFHLLKWISKFVHKSLYLYEESRNFEKNTSTSATRTFGVIGLEWQAIPLWVRTKVEAVLVVTSIIWHSSRAIQLCGDSMFVTEHPK